jgi:hypothetical protein
MNQHGKRVPTRIDTLVGFFFFFFCAHTALLHTPCLMLHTPCFNFVFVISRLLVLAEVLHT